MIKLPFIVIVSFSTIILHEFVIKSQTGVNYVTFTALRS